MIRFDLRGMFVARGNMVRVREATYARSAVMAAKYFILNVEGKEDFSFLCVRIEKILSTRA
jgi:hypothetical protein